MNSYDFANTENVIDYDDMSMAQRMQFIDAVRSLAEWAGDIDGASDEELRDAAVAALDEWIAQASADGEQPIITIEPETHEMALDYLSEKLMMLRDATEGD
ncbi:MAG TPA: hypothetical protein PKD55_00870 [Bellilinea sp.]|nr:hypothetical protein [Bellilinea sp.]